MKFADMYQQFGAAYYISIRGKDAYTEDGDRWLLYKKQCVSNKLHSIPSQQNASQQSPV
jgi:hypothetical protein